MSAGRRRTDVTPDIDTCLDRRLRNSPIPARPQPPFQGFDPPIHVSAAGPEVFYWSCGGFGETGRDCALVPVGVGPGFARVDAMVLLSWGNR